MKPWRSSTGQFDQAVVGCVHRVEPAATGHHEELAGVPVAPGVIGADELRCITRSAGRHRAAVPAVVQEHVAGPGAVPGDQQRIPEYGTDHEVVLLGSCADGTIASGTRRRIWDSSISVSLGIAVVVQRNPKFPIGHIGGLVDRVPQRATGQHFVVTVDRRVEGGAHRASFGPGCTQTIQEASLVLSSADWGATMRCMRRHGWSGDMPVDDEEAEAASSQRPAPRSMSWRRQRLGGRPVTRNHPRDPVPVSSRTRRRCFAGTAMSAGGGFLDRLAEQLTRSPTRPTPSSRASPIPSSNFRTTGTSDWSCSRARQAPSPRA